MDIIAGGTKTTGITTPDTQSTSQKKLGVFCGESVGESNSTVPSVRTASSVGHFTCEPLQTRPVTVVDNTTLELDQTDEHSKRFNEVIRRIPSKRKQEIAQEIAAVSSEQLVLLSECCKDPSLLTGKNSVFFKHERFPYIALRAFRDEKITVSEFATLTSLHEINREGCDSDKPFDLQYQKLFDPNGNPDSAAWETIEKTIDLTNTTEPQLFQFDKDNVLNKMQYQLKTARPLDACFWHCSKQDDSTKTITDIVWDLGSRPLSRYDDREMLPSLSLRQSLADAAFGDEAHQVNPVIGISSIGDLKKGNQKRHRDFALPFPGIPVPRIADYNPAPRTADFQQHDYYHLLRVGQLYNEDVDLYGHIADQLLEQQKRYTDTIDKLKQLCMAKLDAHTEWKKLPPKAADEHQKNLYRQFYAVSKLLEHLKRSRKATGQLKAGLYDMEMFRSNSKQDELRTKEHIFDFHYSNIMMLTIAFHGKVGRELLGGVSANLAGRIIMPILAGFTDNCRNKRIKLEHDYNESEKMITWLTRLGCEQVEAVKAEIKIGRRFVDCLDSHSICESLQNQS